MRPRQGYGSEKKSPSPLVFIPYDESLDSSILDVRDMYKVVAVRVSPESAVVRLRKGSLRLEDW